MATRTVLISREITDDDLGRRVREGVAPAHAVPLQEVDKEAPLEAGLKVKGLKCGDRQPHPPSMPTAQVHGEETLELWLNAAARAHAKLRYRLQSCAEWRPRSAVGSRECRGRGSDSYDSAFFFPAAAMVARTSDHVRGCAAATISITARGSLIIRASITSAMPSSRRVTILPHRRSRSRE
jgi:hypothetical protein